MRTKMGSATGTESGAAGRASAAHAIPVCAEPCPAGSEDRNDRSTPGLAVDRGPHVVRTTGERSSSRLAGAARRGAAAAESTA